MKITKEQLKQIIKEELDAVLSEDDSQLPEGTFEIGGSPLQPYVHASVKIGKESSTASQQGSIAPVIAAINAYLVRYGNQEGSYEETAENVGNAWRNILDIEADLIERGIRAGKIRFEMHPKTWRAFKKQEQDLKNAT